MRKNRLQRYIVQGLIYAGVVTNPDKPKNRGMKFQESEVKQFAVSKNLKMYQPERVKENLEFIETIKVLNPDLICVVAYRKDFTKRNTRYTKVWLYKSACITSSKI